jgi:superfamily I DNA and RNA helicase
LLDLTSEQMVVLQAIRRVKRAMILGGAGTGKTVLAVEKSRQLASSGFRVLLLCYNAPLRQHLASTLHGSSVDVETFHSLVLREARRAKSKTPFDPTSEWYEIEAPRILGEAAARNGTQYDAVLVDEAQDFAMEWLSVTQSLVADDGLLYLFADSHQDLYRRGWSIPEGLVELELTVNCRNTGPIARRVASIFDDRLDGKFVDGPEPRFVEVDRREQLAPYVVGLVESIVLEDKIEPTQLIVLTDSTSVVSELRSTGVAGHLFTTLDGHGIPVETVYRFKGLERDVVVLALSDAATIEDLRAVAYVGLSRAKVGLYVVASRKIKDAIVWGP